MRERAVVWRVLLLVAWTGALLGLVAIDRADGLWYLAVGAPLTVLVGGLVDRWWVLLAPLAVTALLAVPIRALGEDCPDCSEEDGVALLLTVLFVVYTLPALAALAAGLL